MQWFDKGMDLIILISIKPLHDESDSLSVSEGESDDNDCEVEPSLTKKRCSPKVDEVQ